MCYQDAGWKYGPWIGSGDSIRNNSVYVTWREYFERVTDGRSSDDYRMPQEDVRVSLMWGSQVLQRIAQQVRESENKLVMAEKAGVIANLANGYRYGQATLDEGWRTLMLAQHHDSWIVPYNGLNRQGTWAQHIRRWTAATDSLCDGVIAEALQSFAAPGGDGQTTYLRVCNTLGSPRRETVSATLPEGLGDGELAVTNAKGKRVPHAIVPTQGGRRLLFEASVPAFGYTTYTVKDIRQRGRGRTPPGTGTGTDGPAHPRERHVPDRDRPRTGRHHHEPRRKKEGGKEFADPQHKFAFGELRGFFYDQGQFHSSAQSPATVTVLCDNELEKSVRISGRIDTHPFTQTITLRKGERKIGFDLKIDWRHNVGIGAFRQKDGFNNNHRAFYDDRFNLNIPLPGRPRRPCAV